VQEFFDDVAQGAVRVRGLAALGAVRADDLGAAIDAFALMGAAVGAASFDCDRRQSRRR